jgi:DNA-binding MarR family transcriptional regulator
VLRFSGVRVVIYPNDHRPAHVHVIGRGCEAVFNLNCPKGPVELRENYGFSRREIAQIESILTDPLNKLCGEWERIHEIE